MPSDTLTIPMNLGGTDSTFVLGPTAGLELPVHVPAPPPLWLVDRTVADLHAPWLDEIRACCPGADASDRTLVIEGGEGAKSPGQLVEIWDWLAGHALTREGTLVGVGGGTVLDLAGFAAATWRRGVHYVAIPTTLLAMVDAAIGGKTAINTAGLKNPVGSFHPARAILADAGFLTTLPRRWWRDGMAELIKTAIIGEPHLYADLWSHRGELADLLASGPDHEPVPHILGRLPWRDWIGRAARVKADIVNQDFLEGDLRRALNLGHTLGHVLEAWSATGDRPLGHGEAVSIGMAVVFRISAERGRCPLPVALQVIELLETCGLPVRCAAPSLDELERLLAGDKKTTVDTLRWVLPERVGAVDVNATVAAGELLKWLD
ncbi:MAG: 3-dehydroquinate synthase [bacterium]|nr:3-dehydroquinate synthase [bacterium]